MARMPGTDRRRALNCFLGRSVLSHQVDCALELECEAILCLVDGVGQDIIDCQHRAERAGARFQTVGHTHALSSLVRAGDDLVVIADGLLVDPEILAAQLEKRQALVTLPADAVGDRDFERLDAAQVWAGALRIGGDSVERLRQLPPDAGAASAFVRIAMQTGVAKVPLDPAILAEGRWEPAGQAESGRLRETAWIGRRIVPVGFAAPGLAVAERLGLRLARDVLGRRTERIPLFAALGFGMMAGMASIVGRPAIGLVLALPMMFAIPIASMIERVGKIGTRARRSLPLLRILLVATDVLLVALAAAALPPTAEAGWLNLFYPLVLILALRVGQRFAAPHLRDLYRDRILLVGILAFAAIFGVLLPVVAVLCALALAAVLIPDITTD
ncbi:hypothetical protein [Qipengyuania sp. MTN3-11]|uniref:hypothetical protein n=1 Tax=Qipengyuania sp. MTN3-11 TaxID=3056557 RepID=UPI0036F2F13F